MNGVSELAVIIVDDGDSKDTTTIKIIVTPSDTLVEEYHKIYDNVVVTPVKVMSRLMHMVDHKLSGAAKKIIVAAAVVSLVYGEDGEHDDMFISDTVDHLVTVDVLLKQKTSEARNILDVVMEDVPHHGMCCVIRRRRTATTTTTKKTLAPSMQQMKK